jgi:hypothetical protein
MRSWLAIAAVGLATGCVIRDDGDKDLETTGTVDVSWRVGPSGCEAAGITEIELSVGGVGGTYDCEDEGASVSVPAGTHDLLLVGLDGGGDARFGGEELGVVVDGGQTTTVPTVILGALPASLTVNWSFANGLLCTPNGVETVQAFLFEDGTQETELTAPCGDGSMTLEGFEAGTYSLSVFGSDEDGTIGFSALAEVTVERGDTASVTVSLAADEE